MSEALRCCSEVYLRARSCLKCGLSPVTISQSTTPRLQMSAFSLHSCPASTCAHSKTPLQDKIPEGVMRLCVMHST